MKQKKRIESLESDRYSIHNEVAGFKLSIVRELQHVKNQTAAIENTPKLDGECA